MTQPETRAEPGPALSPPDPESAGQDESDAWTAPETDADEPQDWAWVQEWRGSGEPVPWAGGVTMALFTALVVGAAVFVLSSGLADKPVLSVAVNLLVAAGLSPAIWLSRALPVLRWFALGAVLGLLAAWIADFVFLL